MTMCRGGLILFSMIWLVLKRDVHCSWQLIGATAVKIKALSQNFPGRS
jgi:hypothetical protein